MAGIEQLEIHSKSYIVRWVKVEEGHTISWSVQPHKKSINFGIVKHPGTGGTNLTTFQSDLDDSQVDGALDARGGLLFARRDVASTAPEQLRKKGFKLVNWHGKCDADKVAMGTYDVQPGNGGMFGLVFDNTFSKQTSKNATFVLLTYPTGAPPQGARNLPNLQANPSAGASHTNLGKNNIYNNDSPQVGALTSDSFDSLSSHLTGNGAAVGGAGASTSGTGVAGGGGGGGSSSGGGGSAGGKPKSGHAGADAGVGTDAGAKNDAGSSTGPPLLGASALPQSAASAQANYHVGTLMKRRRKRGQGYARRFFSLDYATCTLSYYHNRNSSALRGAIPLSLAAIAADERRREITIDSGAEVWHLKASNVKEFTEWARALERASRMARTLEQLQLQEASGSAGATAAGPQHDGQPPPSGQPATGAPPHAHQEETREWQQVEALVSRVVGTRDALRRLVKNMGAAGVQQAAAHSQKRAQPPSQSLSSATPSVSEESEDYGRSQQSTPPGGSQQLLQPPERRSFWRRRSSASPLMAQGMRPSVASSLAVPTPSTATSVSTSAGGEHNEKGAAQQHHHHHHQQQQQQQQQGEHGMEGHCQALLNDLDSVVAEFSKLLANSKHRRSNMTPATVAAAKAANAGVSMPVRKSFESTSTDEFFDAAEGAAAAAAAAASASASASADQPQLLRIADQSEAEEDTPGSDEASVHADEDDGDASSVSSVEDDEEYTGTGEAGTGVDEKNFFPPKPKSLTPLPITETVTRRTSIPPATVLPPSLIAFVRKNVGKDLSTISMPASANEPTSLLQRVAEQIEYAQLLDQAAAATDAGERLLYVTAFAVSQFSGGRAKERAIRKPFNPLLGETYELVRTENEVPGGLRLLVEKVSHRPVRLVMQADAAAWSVAQAAAPSQKFWGKSAEVVTEGRVRVVLRLPGGQEEKYSWALATVFLRNVVMGEKYVEPVGTMHVVNDSSGAQAAVEFRSKGMFGGRSEDVHVTTFDADGQPAPLGLVGTWTGSLRVVNPHHHGSGAKGGHLRHGSELWTVGPLVNDAPRVYGLTRFAATLNEITVLERGKLAPTDCRLRPDQRLAEEGRLDEAEVWKTRLEEAQRGRRRVLDARGEAHRPRWFVKVASGPDGDEVWRLRGGQDGLCNRH
ncbi:oxysterol-binding protein 1 [Niveomyces insectorum RCEF 264]|uniref:Oxysterol-binding protein 1 n=1 Tax=Niveomyces insectorum RCEF 264 TaxID=1081102 RepID=A0A167VAY2_9HYPO|nr:oxysterol-binding protein 1 [Niveomyces insectorum RCEF 264]